ncbi:tetratricopeptide repeat protein [Phenylobacterium sp.]|uniref:tetratricopeptide repeat protein n=1 Tax=Phenylobacterium sp. TaxID=1871053 RepID=UPI002FD97F81
MTDVFEEVEEQLRADRYKTLALRALPYVLGALVLALAIALGTWGWTSWRSGKIAEASELYDQGIAAVQEDNLPRATELFTQVADLSPDGYGALALMQLGGLKLSEDDVPGAVALFDQAAERAPDEVIGDAARLKSALALLDTASLDDMKARLQPLTQEGRPYRAQALEALAFARIMGGEMDEARADFGVIALMPGASDLSRRRAQAARALIESGSAQVLPEAVKAAMALDQAAPATDDAAAPAPQQQGSAAQ